MFTVLTMPEYERYVRALGKSANLRVVWTDPGSVPCCTATEIRIPRPVYPMDRSEIVRNLHAIEHEVSHTIHSDFEMLNRLGIDASKSFLGFVNNLVEDHRIECIPSVTFTGTCEVINEGYDITCNEVIERFRENPSSEMIDKIRPLLQWDCENRDWLTATIGKDFMSGANSKAREYLDRFRAHPELAETLHALRSVPGIKAGEDILNLAKDILAKVYGMDADDELEKAASASAASSAAKKGKGEEGEKEKEGKGGGEEGIPDSESVDLSEFQVTPKHGDEGSEKKKSGTDSRVLKSGSYQPCLIGETTVINLGKPERSILDGKERRFFPPSKPAAMNPELISALEKGGDSAVFAAKIRQHLQVLSQKHYSFGHKSGKLHGASLHRYALNVPGYSERLFKQKHQQSTLDVSIAVAIDLSGSMYYKEKIYHASVALCMINDAIGNALHVPLMLYGFSGDSNSAMFVMREFNEKIIPRDMLASRLSNAISMSMCQNLDGEALLFGADALKSTRSKRKILIVLSDGLPESTRDGDSSTFLSQVTKSIEASPIELVGIGILNKAVQEFYKNHVVINSASDIDNALLSVIKSKLF